MRTILPAGKNPILREIAREVLLSDIRNPRIRTLIEEMKKLLAKEEFGVALAAPQVGEALQLFVVSGKAIARGKRNSPDEDENEDERGGAASAAQPSKPVMPDQVYINPELIKLSRGRVDKHEGCLSIRGKWGEVPRAEKATIRAYDEHGIRFTRGASGFLAHVFQHEMDHLQGILYTDKATEIYEDKPENEK